MAGDTVTLNCSITLSNEGTNALGISWMGPGVTDEHTQVSGMTGSSYLVLSEVAASQAGNYTCSADYSESLISTKILTVLSKLVYSRYNTYSIYSSPVLVPTPWISINNFQGEYAGTQLSLSCMYTLSPSVDINLSLVVTWNFNGVLVSSSKNGRVSTNETTQSLVVHPVAISDSGRYSCALNFEIVLETPYVMVEDEPAHSKEKDIIVQGIIHASTEMFHLCK